MDARVTPHHLTGALAAIPSKSYAQRILIASLLCEDPPPDLVFENPCNDIVTTQRAVKALRRGDYTLSFGESATLARILTPIMAIRYPHVKTTCSTQLGRRPLENPLRNAPHPGRYRVSGSQSSQYISGLLFALPLLSTDSYLELTDSFESKGYVDITLDVLNRFGITVTPDLKRGEIKGWNIPGNQTFVAPSDIQCEGDWSNMAFFIATGACVTGLRHDTLQPDGRAFLPYCKVQNNGFRLKAGVLLPELIDISQCPDLTPVLAVMAAVNNAPIRITGGRRLRIKESDRLESISRMIMDLGGIAQIKDEGMLITGNGGLRGGRLNSYGDHRIVMAATLASCWCEKPVEIVDAHAVNKSYPGFFEDFTTLGGHVELTE